MKISKGTARYVNWFALNSYSDGAAGPVAFQLPHNEWVKARTDARLRAKNRISYTVCHGQLTACDITTIVATPTGKTVNDVADEAGTIM